MQSLRIPAGALDELAAIRKLTPEKLNALIEHLSSQELLQVGELREAIRDYFDAFTPRVARQLVSLYTVKRDSRATGADLVKSVTDALENVPKKERWTDEELQKWRSLKDALVRLLSIPTLDTVSKALSLSFDYANLLQSAEVVSDIRPVYDDTGDKILAAVISQTLRLHFSSEDDDHTLSVALDQKDLERLRDSCDRALKKAQAAKKLMDESNVRTTITGVTDDAE